MKNKHTDQIVSSDEMTELRLKFPGPFVPPPMTIEKYAELQGLTEETVKSQIYRGQIPSVKHGKRRLVNTFAIAHSCLEEDQNP